MTDLPAVPRDKYRGNQNVPIVAERLLAAIRFRGLSVKAAAELAEEKQQTVQRIVQGKTRRCRHSRRVRLATALDVPDEWLGGAEMPPIPGLPAAAKITLETPEGVLTTLLDQNLARFAEGAASLPPAYQLHWSRLTRRFLDAWGRDMDAGIEDALTLAEIFSVDATGPVEPRAAVSALLQRAMSALWWRRRLLLPVPLPEAPPDLDKLSAKELSDLARENERLMNLRQRGVSPQDVDELGRLGAEVFDLMLRPWLDGARELDYQAAYVLLRWLRDGMLMGVPSGLPVERG